MTFWDLINSYPKMFELHFWTAVLILILIFIFLNLESFSYKDLKMTFKTKEKNEICFRFVNKFYLRKKILILPQEDFNYFFQEGLYEHIYLTPHDFGLIYGNIKFNKEDGKVFRECGLMNNTPSGSGRSIINVKKWSENWNRQEYWDIDFREIDKIVKKNRKTKIKNRADKNQLQKEKLL